MTSSNGNIFRVTGHLCGEFTGDGIHRSPVNSLHKGQWRGALMFPLICVWINGWVNNGEAGDLRRYRAHYDVTLMEVLLQVNHGPLHVTLHSTRHVRVHFLTLLRLLITQSPCTGLSAGQMPPVGSVQEHCQCPLKNGGNSHWSRGPKIHCDGGNSGLYLEQPVTQGWCQPCPVRHWLS